MKNTKPIQSFKMNNLVDAMFMFIIFLAVTTLVAILILHPLVFQLLFIIFIIMILIVFVVIDDERLNGRR